MAGDLNAKNISWHSKTNNRNGINLERIAASENIFIDAPLDCTYRPFSSRATDDVLDVCCFRNVHYYYEFKVIPELCSDHLPIIVTIGKMPLDIVHLTPKKTDWDNYNAILANQEFFHSHIMIGKDEIDSAITNFTTGIREALQASVIPQPKLRKYYTLPADIRQSIRHRNKLFCNWKKYGDPTYQRLYISQAKIITKQIRKFRENKWNDFLSGLEITDHSLWDMTRRLTRKNRNIPAFNINGNHISDDEAKANLLASNYERQFLPNQHNISQFHIKTNNVMKRLIRQEQDEFYKTRQAPLTSKKEVKGHIKNLKNRKAPGIDEIPNIALKHLPENYIKELTRIYNSCLRNVYRPISLLSNLGKILERIFDNHLQKFLLDNNIIQDEQFGFRRHHSTAQQLMRVTEDVHRGFELGGKTAILLIDVEKAFDRLWVQGLLLKCIAVSMPRWMMLFINSFLSYRRFQVQINTEISQEKCVRAGVPQGSVLGPVLFNF